MPDTCAASQSPPAAPEPIAVSVQLRHTLADGSWHIDWLLTPPGGVHDEHAMLISFRAPAPLESLKAGESMAAEQIADHRRVYLAHEGPVSGGRGSVQRISEARVTRWDGYGTGCWSLDLHWLSDPDHREQGELRQRIEATRQNQPPGWRLKCTSCESATATRSDG